MKATPALLLFLSSILLAITAGARDQDCGTSQGGGAIGPGIYSGVGSTCNEAKQSLRRAMMGDLPDCDVCPAGQYGCTPNTQPDDPNGNVVIGNCSEDPVTGLWTVPGTVSATTAFDNICSGCKNAGQGGF